MRCEQFRELISAYIERSIAPPLAAKMEEHAARCPSCRAELEDVRMLWRVMAQVQPVKAPDSLHARIMQEVYARVPATPSLRWWELAWRPRFAFAAAAVLAILALVLWSQNVQTDAIALSVVSSGGSPVTPVKTRILPVRFEPFRAEQGDLRWMLKLNAPQPTVVEVASGGQTVWRGLVARETPVVLPMSSGVSVLEVRVTWDNGSVLRAWLPAELSSQDSKPVLVVKEKAVEETLSRIAGAYSVPLVLMGEADPLTRVSLRSTGVALDELLEKVAAELKLEISRAEDGTTVLTAR